MKKDHHPHHGLQHLPPHKKWIFLRTAAVVLIFSVGYALGLLTSRSASSAPPVLASSSDRESSSPNRSSHSCHDSPKEEKEQQQQQQAPQLPTATATGEEILKPTTATMKTPPPHDFFRFRTRCAPPLPQDKILPTLLDRVYNGTSPYAGFPPPHVSQLLSPKRLRGWGSTAPVFQALIEAVQPTTIVEVGTFLGASALHMANLTSARGTLILCLDDFRGWPGFRRLSPQKTNFFKDIADSNGDVTLMYQFMQNAMEAGEEGRVLPVPFSSAAGLTALCEWGVYADLVEVDAAHDFHSAWQDINLAWAVVRPGGVMFGHDYHLRSDNHGVRRAVDLFARTHGLRVQPNGQHWVLHPPKPQ